MLRQVFTAMNTHISSKTITLTVTKLCLYEHGYMFVLHVYNNSLFFDLLTIFMLKNPRGPFSLKSEKF